MTAPDNPSSASTPAIAGLPASATHLGIPEAVNKRMPARDPTPIAAPIACTASTPANARSALGVCSSVSTDAASWTTAKEMAAMSSGPPNADAKIHRMTNQDPCGGVATAVVRAVPHTIASTGSSGITPSSVPPIDTGT